MAFVNPPGLGGSWIEEARRQPTLSDLPHQAHPADEIMAGLRPYNDLVRLMRLPTNRNRLLLGTTDQGWNMSEAASNVGVPGRPRGFKTSATAFTAAATHNGPILYFTTKVSESMALGMLRGLMAGDTAELSFIGLGGGLVPSGFTPRGSTPISDSWLESYAGAHAMAGAATGSGMSDAQFWKITGAAVLGPLYYGGALAGKDMEWVCRLAATQNEEDLTQAIEILTAKGGRPGRRAADRLEWASGLPDRTKASVWATASAALMPYETEESLNVTELPALDVNTFVRGHPDAINPYLTDFNGAPVKGCWPTTLVVAPLEELKLFAPVVVHLFTKIRRARYALHHADEDAKNRNHPLLLAIFDDLPALAPDVTMPSTLAQSGGQSVQCLVTFHDPNQLRGQWGEEGKSMQTTLSELVVHRAVRDPELLELLSSLSGQIHVEDRTEGVTRNPASFGIAGGGFTRQSRSVSTSESVQRRLMRRLYPDEISFGYGGAHGDPSVVLTLHPTSLGWTRMHPYFSSPLWLRAIIAAMEQLAELPPNPRHLLAPPELEQHGVSDHLVAASDDWTLVERYRSARAALEARALEYRRANGDDHSGPYDGTDPTPPNGGGSDPARPKNSPDDSGAPRDTCSPDQELEAA